MAKDRNIGNKRPENHKEYTKFYGGGISADNTNEIAGVVNQDKYLRGKNIRVSSKKNSSAAERIGGERLIHTYAEDNERYICILETNINSHKVTIWASIDWSETSPTNGVMAIDDTVMLSSDKFPVRHIHPFDHDKNENCLGGELYITDNNLPPMYFNIQDIIDNFNAGTDKYFEDFDYKNYTINTLSPMNSLVFIGLKDTQGLNGLPGGQYSYQYRAVTENGERTNWSIPTPLIIVPFNVETQQNTIFNFTGTKGKDGDNSIRTKYSPILKLRVDNEQCYDYIELKRISYNNGEGYGYSPLSSIVQKINISNNQFNVIEIIDSKDNETDEIKLSTDDDVLNVSSIIKRAESIRYFKNKIVLLNIEYEDTTESNINLEFTEIDNEIANPVLKFLGSSGHKDAKNSCYYRSNLNGEIETYSIVLWDENMQKILSIPIERLKNYKFPDKRKNLDGYTMSENNTLYLNEIEETVNNISPNSFFELPSQDTNIVEKVFEVVLNTNIDIGNPIDNTDEINILDGEYTPNYKPRTPVSDYDKRYKGRNVLGSTNVSTEGYLQVDYSPDGFSPVFQSLGLSIYGIDNFPDWCKAFSILKTNSAKRVIAQGIAVYPLEEKGQAMLENITSGIDGWTFDIKTGNLPSDTKTDITKDVLVFDDIHTLRQAVKKSKKIVHVHCPDIESGFISESFIESLISDPSAYKLQFIEPLAFFSDVMHASKSSLNTGTSFDTTAVNLSHQIDMVTHAVCQNEDLMTGSMVGLDDGTVWTDKYAYFGGNRAMKGSIITSLSMFLNQLPSSDGFKTNIVSVSKIIENNSFYLEIEVEDDVWMNKDIVDFTARHWSQQEVKKFHEHVYIVNIINDSAEIKDESLVKYQAPINYIKIKSTVGLCNNDDTQVFECVDERVEDYKVRKTKKDINFIFIERNNVMLNFINITEIETYFPGDISAIDYDIDNNSDSYCGKKIHGKYKTIGNFIYISTDYSYTVYTQNSTKIRFGDKVIVMYNKNYPISVFGGDIMHNRAIFTYKDRECNNGGNISEYRDDNGDNSFQVSLSEYKNQFMLGVGMPFMQYKLNQNVKKCWIKDGITHYGFVTGKIHGLNFIRQWLWSYICQSRINLSYMYGDFYPNISYVERPLVWSVSNTTQENHIHSGYLTDYTESEKEKWNMGGFRTNQITGKNPNYSTLPEHYKVFSQKFFLQEKNVKYCTRVIWSQTRPIQSFNAPNLKTFRPFNYKDISDKFGDGRKLFISSDRYGDNLYAFCENDIALLLVSKRTLSDASGNIIGTTGNSDSQFINQEEWQNIGAKKGLQKLHKWTWAEDGNRAFYANKNGVFMFEEGQDKVKDITDGNRESIINEVQESFGNLFKRTAEAGRNIVELECLGHGFYDNKFNEYGFITKLPVVVANDMCFDTPEETNNNYYDITDCNNILFEILYNDEFSDEVFLKLIENSPLDITLNKSFYIRKVVAQDVTVRIYEDATSTLTEHILDAGDEYFKITRTVVSVNEFENDAEWSVQVINKETLENVRNVFVYCTRENVKAWVSENEYIFDKIQTSNGKKYGFRNMKCYELESGNILNGEYIKAEIIDVINPDKEDLEQEKEFVRIQVNTQKELEEKDKLSIDFLKDNQDTIHSSISGDNMNKYGGYTNYIPRNPYTSKRYQDNKILFRIMYNGKDNISITSVDIQYKILK